MKRMLFVALFLVPAGIYLAYDIHTARPEFSPARLAGTAVLTEQGERLSVVFLTMHEEFPPSSLTTIFEPNSWLHVDLWTFAADDLTPRWVQRIMSRANRSAPDSYAIIGIEDGTIWLLADRLYAVALADGRRIGDAVSIEARNPALAGKLHIPGSLVPSGTRFTFETGLEVTVAGGTQWRIDPKTLLASPVEARRPAARGAALSWPMRGSKGQQALKARGILIDGAWYGMAHASEGADILARGALQPGLADQDFRLALQYQLWSARVITRPHPFFPGQSFQRAEGFAPVAHSPSFLRGGLLAARLHDSRNQVLLGTNPHRLLVLHQNRTDEAARQTLTCLGLDGARCWDARLDLSIVYGAARLEASGPQTATNQGAVILSGVLYPLDASRTRLDDTRSADDVIIRVALHDGSLKHIYLGSLDMRALAEELAK